jgi:hypothetical protein
MNTLKLGGFSLAMFAVAVIGWGGFASEGQTQEKKAAPETKAAAHSDHHAMGMMACAQACSNCQRACDGCATHCAHELQAGHKEHMATLMSCQDCATFCAAASQIVSRNGPFSALVCTGCADACANCAKECEKFADDAHMKACAAECRKCEKACREMLSHATAAK